jgi:aminoglycoside 2''-phosphotransferase
MVYRKFIVPMNKFQKYVHLIQQNFPTFRISSIKKVGEGDNSKAFLVNENYIFRFPKRKDVKQQVRKEICVLPKIRSALNLQIPGFEFISPELHYVGYKKIEGVVLTNKIFQSLKKKEQHFLEKTIADFLHQLHSFSVEALQNCGLETMNLYEEYAENFENAKQLIFPEISKNKREMISRLFTEYLSDENNFNFTPALVHNDLSKDHVLFDTVNKEITGIIDFGDVAFGDPDYDFMYLLDEFGEDFLMEILKYYPPPNRPVSRDKIHFFSLANKIQIVLQTLEINDEDDKKKAYEDLDEWFRKFKSY